MERHSFHIVLVLPETMRKLCTKTRKFDEITVFHTVKRSEENDHLFCLNLYWTLSNAEFGITENIAASLPEFLLPLDEVV